MPKCVHRWSLWLLASLVACLAPCRVAFAQTSAIPVNVVLMLPNSWAGQTYSGMTFNPTNQGRTLILWPCTNCGGSGTSIIMQITITGLTNLNGSTTGSQTFAVGTGGSDFNIASLAGVHTFNLPTASATVRGALSSVDWTTFNSKSNHLVQTNSVDLGSAGTVNWTTGVTGYVSGGVLFLGVNATGSSGGLTTNGSQFLGVPLAFRERAPMTNGLFWSSNNTSPSLTATSALGATVPFVVMLTTNGTGLDLSSNGVVRMTGPDWGATTNPAVIFDTKSTTGNYVYWRLEGVDKVAMRTDSAANAVFGPLANTGDTYVNQDGGSGVFHLALTGVGDLWAMRPSDEVATWHGGTGRRGQISNVWDIFVRSNLTFYARSGAANTLQMLAPATIPTSYILTWPTTNGIAGQTLFNDGSGLLAWKNDATGSGAPVGGSTAIQLDRAGQFFGTNGSIEAFTYTNGTLVVRSQLTPKILLESSAFLGTNQITETGMNALNTALYLGTFGTNHWVILADGTWHPGETNKYNMGGATNPVRVVYANRVRVLESMAVSSGDTNITNIIVAQRIGQLVPVVSVNDSNGAPLVQVDNAGFLVLTNGLTNYVRGGTRRTPTNTLALGVEDYGGFTVPTWFDQNGYAFNASPARWNSRTYTLFPSAGTTVGADGITTANTGGTTISHDPPDEKRPYLINVASAATSNSVGGVSMTVNLANAGAHNGSSRMGGFFFSTEWMITNNIAGIVGGGAPRFFVGLANAATPNLTNIANTTNATGEYLGLMGDPHESLNLFLTARDAVAEFRTNTGVNFVATNLYNFSMFTAHTSRFVGWRLKDLTARVEAAGWFSNNVTTNFLKGTILCKNGTNRANEIYLDKMYLQAPLSPN